MHVDYDVTCFEDLIGGDILNDQSERYLFSVAKVTPSELRDVNEIAMTSDLLLTNHKLFLDLKQE